MKDIQISYAENWQKQHWKSLKSAYQSSPYFEYYEDKLIELFKNKEKFLLDFNLQSISIIQNILKIEKAYSLNSEYQKTPLEFDYRNQFSTKKETKLQMEEYYQLFSDKYGFLKNLSIIDIVCNKGPETITYLKNII